MSTDTRHGAVWPLAFVLLLACAACQGTAQGPSGTSPGASTSSATVAPDYTREMDHFSKLQVAGLTGNYQAFVQALRGQGDAELQANLTRSFGGQPFDVYTRATGAQGGNFKRLLELRNSSGRLYVLVRMRSVPGGWKLDGYEIDRQADTLRASL